MTAPAMSFATRLWLAGLLAEGWTATVVERQPMRRHVVVYVDDLESDTIEVRGDRQVGVLADRDRESVIFIPCASEDEARGLLEQALAEAEA